MSRLVFTMALAAALAPIAGAQQPGPRPGGPGPGMMGGGPGAASMLLSQTAELKLSDAQVTRLAAIARRTADRRAANRVAMDSMRAQFRPNPQGGAQTPPAGPPAAARALMERIRTQEHEDLRDALSVLTPDQQANAWEKVAQRGMMRRNGARMRQMRQRPGRMGRDGGRMGPGMGPGMAPQPGGRGMRRPLPPDSAARRAPVRRPEQ
jgi:hypothetical protein